MLYYSLHTTWNQLRKLFRTWLFLLVLCVLLGGGYGCAAMLFCAHWAVVHGRPAPQVLLGARSQGDILLEEEFRRLGCQVGVSTDDGSYGMPGRITVLLEAALKRHPNAWLAACGPKPMLKAVAMRATGTGSPGWISMDRHMICGVGACYDCIQKIVRGNSRCCIEGPVFAAKDLVW